MPELERASTESLIAQFEHDIHFGCDSVRSEVDQSSAGQELRRRGKHVYETLKDHVLDLESESPESILEDVVSGWSVLLSLIDHDMQAGISLDSVATKSV